MLTWKIEELLETKPEEQEYPAILYRGDALRRKGCNCSGLVPKYAQYFCHHSGEPDVTGEDLLKKIRSSLEEHLETSKWWKKMPKPISNWEALLLAQHYGLSTRFLDWTWDPHVALYFATHKARNGKSIPKTVEDGDAVVWICYLGNASRQEMPTPHVRDWYVNPNEELTPFWRSGKKLKTRFFKPANDLGDRVKNQASVMCRPVFRPKDQGVENCLMVPLDKNKDFSRAVRRVVISAYDYKSIQSVVKEQLMFTPPFPDLKENWCKNLTEALRPLSNWPECPWKEFEEMRCGI